MFLERCPVHHTIVAKDGEGRWTLRCHACVSEASAAVRVIEAESFVKLARRELTGESRDPMLVHPTWHIDYSERSRG